MKLFLRKRTSGFTLVEMLIVVAIIGVLATIGVPTFRKMVQKAKKSEAKVGLGALYTVETAFYSEYGTYGNNVSAIGFELQGNNANRIYSMGFLAAGANCSTGGVTTFPLSTAALSVAYPAYFSGTPTYALMSPTTTGACSSGFSGSVAQSTFGVVAGGIISPSTGATGDVWTMDQNSTLANQVDGVK